MTHHEPFHEQLPDIVHDLPAVSTDVLEAQPSRRGRRTWAVLGAAVCAVLLTAGITLGPSLLGSGGAVSATAYYPVGALLPSDVTDLRRVVLPTESSTTTGTMTLPPETAVRSNVYSFTRDGRTGYLSVVTYVRSRANGIEAFAIDTGCPTPRDPTQRASICKTVSLPGGATALISGEGARETTSSGTPPWYGPSIAVYVTYPDNRIAIVSALSSFGSPTKVTTAPPLTQDEVMRMATSQDWFSPASAN